MIGFESRPLSLLWRGTRDGFGSAAFHSLCDGKANTLTIVKSITGFIFGGYTSLAWSSVAGYKPDNTAFLFSLTNPASMPLKMKIKPEKEQYAVYHNSNYGPTFGKGHDLHVHDASNSNTESFTYSSSSYDGPNGKAGKFILGNPSVLFQSIEVEVFQIV